METESEDCQENFSWCTFLVDGLRNCGQWTYCRPNNRAGFPGCHYAETNQPMKILCPAAGICPKGALHIIFVILLARNVQHNPISVTKSRSRHIQGTQAKVYPKLLKCLTKYQEVTESTQHCNSWANDTKLVLF